MFAHDRTPKLLSTMRRALNEKTPPSLLRKMAHPFLSLCPPPCPVNLHLLMFLIKLIRFLLSFNSVPTRASQRRLLENSNPKNKELPFTFELSEENYLSALLKEHIYEKYTPVKKQHHFGIKVGIGAKKAYVSGYYSHHN